MEQSDYTVTDEKFVLHLMCKEMCQKQSNSNVLIHSVNVHIGAFQNQV